MGIYTPRPDAEQLLIASELVHTKHSAKVLEDPEYPKLHLAPPVGRLNDPNGLLYDDGVYHAFYQYSPLHPTRAVFWRHATSTDLTTWKDDRTAIAPISWYDKSGCYSGSGFIAPDGTYEFFYTGNVKDEYGNRSAYQSMFVSPDKGISFLRDESNPLIMDQPEGYTAHFRDPHMVERDGTYYAIIGAQRTDLTGTVVMYSSKDRRDWSFVGEIEFSDPTMRSMGYMFECPLLFSITDEASGEEKDIIMFCPQGMDAVGEKYNNIYQCGYVVGKLTGTRFEVEQSFTEVDAGFEFYAPQTIHAAEKAHVRPVLMAWFGNAEEDDQPSIQNRWVHMLTYPRELTLYEGKLYQRPVPQLDEVLPLHPAVVDDEGVIAHLDGRRQFRLAGTADVDGGAVRLSMRDTLGEPVVITLSNDQVSVDRGGCRYQAGGPVRSRKVVPAKTRDFDILFDGSAMEVFIDGGAEVFSARVFLGGAPQKMIVRPQHADGASVIENLRVGFLRQQG